MSMHGFAAFVLPPAEKNKKWSDNHVGDWAGTRVGMENDAAAKLQIMLRNEDDSKVWSEMIHLRLFTCF